MGFLAIWAISPAIVAITANCYGRLFLQVSRPAPFTIWYAKMKLIEFALIALLVGAGAPVHSTLGAQENAHDTRAETPMRPIVGDLTPAQLQSDFDLMRRALEEVHSGLYRYTPKADMDRTFATQRAKLSHSMTETKFLAVVGETLAQIHCGHTQVSLEDQTQAAMTRARKFPLQMLMEEKRLIVLLNDATDNKTIRPGMELTEINGRKVADILKRIWRAEPADGDIQTDKRKQVGNFADFYWELVDRMDDFTVKLRDATGKRVVAKLTGVTDAERKKNKNPVNAAIVASLAKLNWSHQNLSLRFLKDTQIAEIRMQHFVGDDFPKWIEDTFTMLREKGTKTLILDLRGNRGGRDMYGAMLVSYLTDKPFRYFDHINVKTINPSISDASELSVEFERKLHEGTVPNPAGGYLVTAKLHPGVAEQAPGKYPFLGKVFVLIDGGTFSTAADFCAVTHHLKLATFVGEETGGGYFGNNSGPMPIVTLPNSKLRVSLPMYEYWNAVSEYDNKRRGTRPDYVVETRTADLLTGVDAPLDLALKLAGD